VNLFSEWLTLEGHRCVSAPAKRRRKPCRWSSTKPTDVRGLLDLRMARARAEFWLARPAFGRAATISRSSWPRARRVSTPAVEGHASGVDGPICSSRSPPAADRGSEPCRRSGTTKHHARETGARPGSRTRFAHRSRELSEAFIQTGGSLVRHLEALAGCASNSRKSRRVRATPSEWRAWRRDGALRCRLSGRRCGDDRTRAHCCTTSARSRMPDAADAQTDRLTERRSGHHQRTTRKIGRDILAVRSGDSGRQPRSWLTSHEWGRRERIPHGLNRRPALHSAPGNRRGGPTPPMPLTNSRVYRDRRGRFERGKRELVRMAGIQFDPDVVPAPFLRVADQFAVPMEQ